MVTHVLTAHVECDEVTLLLEEMNRAEHYGKMAEELLSHYRGYQKSKVSRTLTYHKN